MEGSGISRFLSVPFSPFLPGHGGAGWGGVMSGLCQLPKLTCSQLHPCSTQTPWQPCDLVALASQTGAQTELLDLFLKHGLHLKSPAFVERTKPGRVHRKEQGSRASLVKSLARRQGGDQPCGEGGGAQMSGQRRPWARGGARGAGEVPQEGAQQEHRWGKEILLQRKRQRE